MREAGRTPRLRRWLLRLWLRCRHQVLGRRHGRLVLERVDGIPILVLPDVFIDQDSPAAMYAKAGLDAKGIVTKVFEALGRDVHAETVRLA